MLGYLKQIPVCTHYELDGTRTGEFPFPSALDRAKPVIEMLEGWDCDISGVRNWMDLPEAARNYVDYVEEQLACPIRCVSVGPDRDAYVIHQR